MLGHNSAAPCCSTTPAAARLPHPAHVMPECSPTSAAATSSPKHVNNAQEIVDELPCHEQGQHPLNIHQADLLAAKEAKCAGAPLELHKAPDAAAAQQEAGQEHLKPEQPVEVPATGAELIQQFRIEGYKLLTIDFQEMDTEQQFELLSVLEEHGYYRLRATQQGCIVVTSDAFDSA